MNPISIVGVRPVGKRKCIDVEVSHNQHNFLANGVLTSNSHSICYAATAAKTVYLKYWFPKEFFCTLLEQANADPDPFAEIEKISQELPYFRIKLLPPDLKNSNMKFCIEGKNIRYGLKAIKGVSEQTLQKVINFREDTRKNICDIYTSAKRAGLSIAILSSFAQAGLFDSFLNGKTRCYMVYTLQVLHVLTDRQRESIFAIYRNMKDAHPNQEFDLLEIIADCVTNETKGDDGKIIFRGGFDSLKKKCLKYKAIYDQNKRMPEFADWWYEKSVLGYSFSKKLKEIFKDSRVQMADSEEINTLSDYSTVKFVGWVGDDFMEGKSKKNKEKYWRFSVNDEKGKVTCLAMDKVKGGNRVPTLTNYIKRGGEKLKENDIIVVVGSKCNDIIFVQDFSVVDEKICTKFSQLKEQEA